MTVELIPDDLWNLIAALLPLPRPNPKGGRLRVPDRECLRGIVFVLRRLIQIVACQAILACAAAGVLAGQAGTASDSSGTEIEIVRLLGTAESDYHQAYGRFTALTELLGSGQLKLSAEQSGNLSAFQQLEAATRGDEPVLGFSLDLMVASDGAAYKLSLTPKSGTCMIGWFTGSTGALYEGKPVGCEVAATKELKTLESTPTAHETGTPLAVVSAHNWAPPDVDQTVPPARQDVPCPLSRLLAQASKHAEELVENLEHFSAKERIEHIEFRKNGTRRSSQTDVFDYVAQIEENPSGALWVEEYREDVSPKPPFPFADSSPEPPPPLADTGTAAFALIFHPRKVANFDFQCEGLTDLQGVPAWQVHFQETPDPAKSFHAMRIGKTVYPLRFKGRAWIAAATQEVLRLQTDLVAPIPQIELLVENLEIAYAPVEFKMRNLHLWLPESATLYVGYRGHRYKRVHTFSKFQLFWVDTAQAVKEPATGPSKLIK
jgi:hypothetical protein